MGYIENVSFRLRHRLYSVMVRIGIRKKRALIAEAGSTERTFYGKHILAAKDGNDFCLKLLMDRKPCMLARIGTVEMGVIQASLDKRAGILKEIGKDRIDLLCNNAGFFPKDENAVDRFTDVYLDAAKDMDAFGVFCNHMEDLFAQKYAPQAVLMQFTAFESFYFSEPWSYALKGKKVLVVHPFEDSIIMQYSKRAFLFENPKVLPEFELKTIKAVQTIGNETAGFENWFCALEYMKEEINKIEFDTALIGCGAYAFPLAAHVKRMGKQAVVTAGATQLLFGIKGARWDNAETPVPYNQFWVRPGEAEKPKDAQSVENGCYW